jgi:hypothetical protein
MGIFIDRENTALLETSKVYLNKSLLFIKAGAYCAVQTISMHALIILALLAVLCRFLGAWTFLLGAVGLSYVAFILWHMFTYSF